jgi:hypothetical protein
VNSEAVVLTLHSLHTLLHCTNIRTKVWKMGVAGISPVEGPGLVIENLDLSSSLIWHLNYPKILPQVMAQLHLED